MSPYKCKKRKEGRDQQLNRKLGEKYDRSLQKIQCKIAWKHLGGNVQSQSIK